MAIYRPAVLQYVDPLESIEVGYPFKDGIVVSPVNGPEAITVAPPGAYVPADWPYRILGPDQNTGVVVARKTYF